MENSNPTYTLQSFHLTEKFNLRSLYALFQTTPHATDFTRVAFKNKAGDGYVFVFNFGTICFFNTPKDEQKAIIDMLSTQYSILQPVREWDDFPVEITNSKRHHIHVGFNKATLNVLTFERIDIIALIIAESVTLDYYESIIDELLEKSSGTADVLMRKGRLSGSVSSIHRSIGAGMATKQVIVANLYLLDKPEVLWEDEQLERLYRGMFRVFEIRERFMGIEFKLKTLQDNMALIGSLINSRRGTRLELTIIALIFIEIVLFAYEIFK